MVHIYVTEAICTYVHQRTTGSVRLIRPYYQWLTVCYALMRIKAEEDYANTTCQTLEYPFRRVSILCGV